MRTLRYGLAAIAIALSAWFVIGARQAHEIAAATTLLANQAGNSAAASSRTSSLLSSADFLYPGTELTLLRARLQMERHDYAKAKPLVDQAVASEPDNLNAWIAALDLALVDRSAENSKEVIAHLRTEDPIDVGNLTGR